MAHFTIRKTLNLNNQAVVLTTFCTSVRIIHNFLGLVMLKTGR